MVQVALQRDQPDWRIQNACPACTYKLEGEPKLIFSMLYTFDGNDSLKRILRRATPVPGDMESGGTAEPAVGLTSERIDSRQGGGDYFLSREKVDRWAKTVLEELLAEEEVISLVTGLLACPLIEIIYRAMKSSTPAKNVEET